MAEYGVTEKGFVLKRLDSIMEEVHADLTNGFGFNTNLQESSFLNVLVTTFCNQIAEVWEAAQESYYAKFPFTATGVNLDNAVQFGGIRRLRARQTIYPLHCTGDDGTVVQSQAIVASDTKPQKRLFASEAFIISRNAFNSATIKCAVAESGSVYSVKVGKETYTYTSSTGTSEDILQGLANAMQNDSQFTASIDADGNLKIADNDNGENAAMILSDNLTTVKVTTIANFYTEEYGKVTMPDGLIRVMITNIPGFDSVINTLVPTYGRDTQTDIELRQDYLAKSGLRSNTMLDSIVSELITAVSNVESATAYENDGDETNERGLPPHSIEIVVEGGDDQEIANAILKRKAGGIQTYGNITVNASGLYGDAIPIKFSRPDYKYAWIKVTLHGSSESLPSNYEVLTKDSILADTENIKPGDDILIQKLTDRIYNSVAGLTFIDITTATKDDNISIPSSGEYAASNIYASDREKILVDATRIEVAFSADT